MTAKYPYPLRVAYPPQDLNPEATSQPALNHSALRELQGLFPGQRVTTKASLPGVAIQPFPLWGFPKATCSPTAALVYQCATANAQYLFVGLGRPDHCED